jgi:hypothetical protein
MRDRYALADQQDWVRSGRAFRCPRRYTRSRGQDGLGVEERWFDRVVCRRQLSTDHCAVRSGLNRSGFDAKLPRHRRPILASGQAPRSAQRTSLVNIVGGRDDSWLSLGSEDHHRVDSPIAGIAGTRAGRIFGAEREPMEFGIKSDSR